ncbi:MAG: DUF2125 domain-containing protein [Alphaproteobacteria bacterium]|nr:DUF2125 domain-containing protein [Alphaproteobacteria bacterium]
MFLKRKKIIISLLLLLLISIGWIVFFEYGKGELKKKINHITKNLQQKGYVISYSSFEIGGNPFSVKAKFKDALIKDPKGRIEWRGQEADITMCPWKFYTLNFNFPGDQKILTSQNTVFPSSDIQFEGAKGIFVLAPEGGLEGVDFTIDRIKSVVGTQVQPIFLEGSSVKVENIVDPLDLKLKIVTSIINLEKLLNMDKSLDKPLTLSLDANLSGYQTKGSFPTSFSEWRDGGGVLDVNLLTFSWPPISGEMEGTLTLDKELYPLGSFSSKILGYQEAIDYMVKLGLIKKKKALAASFMIGLFSRSDESGKMYLTLPLTFQNKTCSIGPAPLFKLKSLEDL